MCRYNTYTDLTFPSGLHNHCEIIVVSQGEMIVMTNAEPVTLKEGEGVFLPGYVIHSFLTPEHSRCHVWEYDPSFIREKLSANIQTFCFSAEALTLFDKRRNGTDLYAKNPRSTILHPASAAIPPRFIH